MAREEMVVREVRRRTTVVVSFMVKVVGGDSWCI
jgi:hypothetical protein